jgi:uroporphyrinogen-III synthase
MSFDLSGLQILVTRPKPYGEQLCEQITTQNGQAIYFPTLQIVPIKNNLEEIKELAQADWIIFISPQAVLCGIPAIQKYWPAFPDKIKLIAMGEGTAKALSAKGFMDVIHPEEWTSEGLLKLPHFQALSGKQIVLIKGVGGRELLAETLMARGAKVRHIHVYRRELPTYDKIDLLRLQKIDIIVCASGETLRNLITLMGASNQTMLFQIPLVLVSQRLVELARELGFKNVFLAKNASHNAIIDTLCFIKGNGHVRK